MKERMARHEGQYALTRLLSKPLSRGSGRKSDNIDRVYGDSRQLHPWEAYAVSAWFSICVIGMIGCQIYALLPHPILLPIIFPVALVLYIVYMNALVVGPAPLTTIISRQLGSEGFPEYRVSGIFTLSGTALYAAATLLSGWPGQFFALLFLVPLVLNALLSALPAFHGGNR